MKLRTGSSASPLRHSEPRQRSSTDVCCVGGTRLSLLQKKRRTRSRRPNNHHNHLLPPTYPIRERYKPSARRKVAIISQNHYQTTQYPPFAHQSTYPKDSAINVSFPSLKIRIQRRCSSTSTPGNTRRTAWGLGRRHYRDGPAMNGMGIGEVGLMGRSSPLL